MKREINYRILGLAAILVVLIAVGAFTLFGGFDKSEKPANGASEKTGFTVADGVKYVADEPLTFNGAGGENMEFMRFEDRCAAFYKYEIIDVASGEVIMDIPDGFFEKNGNTASFCITPEGDIGILTVDEQGDNLLFWLYNDKFELIEGPTKLNGFEGDWLGEKPARTPIIEQFFFDGENICVATVVAGQGVLQIFDNDGNLRITRNGWRFDCGGNGKLYIVAPSDIDGGGAGFLCIDLQTLETDYEVVIPDYIMGIQAHAKSDRVFCWTDQGIITYSMEDGEEIEMVLDPISDPWLSDDVWQEWGFCVGTDGTLYYSALNRDTEPWQVRYICYNLQKVERVERTETLTITAPFRSDYIEQLIGKFEYENPTIKVNYEYAYNERRAFLLYSEEYYGKLALRILTGDVGDLVMLGGERTIRREFLSSDALVDLTPFLAKAPDRAQYDERMLNGVKLNNATRAMPLAEYFPTLIVDVAKLKELGIEIDYKNMTWSEFLGLTKVLEQKAPDVALIADWNSYVAPDSAGMILQRMLTINSADLINLEEETVNLQQQWFIDLLNQWKEATKSPCFWKRVDYGVDATQGKALFSTEASGDEIGLREDGGKFYRYVEANKDGKEHVYVSLPKGEMNSNRIAYSWDIFGISAASTKQDAAWDFLEFAAREDNQQLKSLISIPLNKQARIKRLESVGKDYGNSERNENYFMRDILGICDEVDYLYDSGDYKHILYQAVLKFLGDEITLDEALKTAEHDIWIRLNE